MHSFFAKRKRSALCFVVNEGFFFSFSLLIFLQGSRTRRTLEKLALTLDFPLFASLLTASWKLHVKLLAYHDRMTMTADQYFSFCHNLEHFLRNYVLLYDFFLLLSIFLLLITVAVLVQEFAFFFKLV